MLKRQKRDERPFGSRGVGRDLSRLLAPWAAAGLIAGLGLNTTLLAGFEPTSSSGRDNADGNGGGAPCSIPSNGAPGGGLGMAVPSFGPTGPTNPNPEPGTDGPAMSGMGPKGSELLSDPIDFSIGDFTTSCVDLSIPGRGFDFEFKRTYRGNDSLWFEYGFPQWDGTGPDGVLANTTIGPMGAQWDHSYSMLIFTQDDPEMTPVNLNLDWPHPNLIKDGRIDSFSVEILDGLGSSDIVWGHPDLDGTMRFVPEDSPGIPEDRFIYNTASGGEYTFKKFGFTGNDQLVGGGANAGAWFRVTDIRDRNGNHLEISYIDDTARIDFIDDTLNNRIDFRYEHAENDYLLTSIVDETGGRTISYTYYKTNLSLPCITDYTTDLQCSGGGEFELDSSAGSGCDGSSGGGASMVEITDLQQGQVGGNPPVRNGWAYVLESVTMPEVGYDANSDVYDAMPSDLEHNNRYSTGRVWNYSYDLIGIDDLDGDDCSAEIDAIRLRTITDPAGTVILHNHYCVFAVDDGPLRGRPYIIQQDAPDDDNGDPVNYQYEYTTGLDIDGDSFNDDYRVTVSTKRRQVIELDYVRDESRRPDAAGSFFCFDSDLNGSLSGYGRVSNILIGRRHKTGYATDTSPFTISVAKDRPLDDLENEYSTTYTRNDNWKLTDVDLPNGLSLSMDYGYNTVGSSSGPTSDTQYERAYKKLAVTSRTRDDGSTTITESWSYEFDFGGCCGSNFPTEYIDGNGNKTIYSYDSRGNVTKIERGVVGSNAVSTEEFEYDAMTGQLIKHTHPKRWIDGGVGGKVEASREDVYEYWGTGTVGYGRLKKIIVDSGGKNLDTEFFYDAVGNVIKVIQPNDNYKTMIWNQANQLVREQWWGPASDTLPAITLLSWREYFYDSRGNPVRTDEVAFDSPDATATRSSEVWAMTLHEYDSLNNLIRTARRLSVAANSEGTTLPPKNSQGGYWLDPSTPFQWDPANWAITEYEYDNNKNLTVVRLPEAVAWNQPDNGYVTTYDERDMPLRRFEGIANFGDAVIPASTGDPANDPLPVIHYMDYDPAGNLVESAMIDPLSGIKSRVRIMTYDDMNRVKTQTDPMGNWTEFVYDANSNVTQTIFHGQLLDDAGTTGEQLLGATKTSYDALNRPYLKETAVFDLASPPANVASVSQWQWAETVYNEDSSVYKTRVPAGPSPAATSTASGDIGVTEYLYDSASRIARVTMPDGSESELLHDDNSNIIAQTAHDHSSLDSTTETYTTTHGYDGMNRRTRTVQGDYGASGPKNTTLMAYDSRSNLIEATDPRLTVTEYFYDGLSRRVQTQVDGSGLDIDTLVAYDRSSRVISLTDDNSNITGYTFDSLGREIARTYADSTTHTTKYDDFGNPAKITDARGLVTYNLYDQNDRLKGREFDRSIAMFVGGSVIGTADVTVPTNWDHHSEWDEFYQYDGKGRVVTANNEFSQVSRGYDSRGFLLSETTNADMDNAFPGASDREVLNTYDLAGNLTRCVYPGGRDVRRAYDTMNRVTGIWDDFGTSTGDIAGYDYLGAGRVHERRTGAASVNGSGVVRTGYGYAGFSGATSISGDYGFRQVREIRHELTAGSTLLEGRGFTWDAAGNKTTHNDLRTSYTGYRERTLSYDAANRLTVSDTAFPSAPGDDGTVTYTLDGVHNRTAVSLTGNNTSGAPIGTYDNSLGDNAALNQYSVTPRLDGGAYDFEHGYDFNGNLMLIAEYPRTADMDGDYDLDGADVSAFTAAFQAGDESADLNNDDIYDQADLTAFTSAFTGGPADGFYNAALTYDQRNQLVGFRAVRGSFSTPIKESSYRYDCFNRRVATIIDSSDSDDDTPNGRTAFFVYAGQAAWQLIEEYRSANDTSVGRSYSYGRYIDEVLTLHDYGSLEDFYYYQDDLFSVYAMTDDSGAVVERYEYGDYGQVSIADAAGVPRAGSLYGNVHSFTGRISSNELALDDGSQLMEYRNRYTIASSGRFLQRDPLGYYDSMNSLQYAVSNPATFIDPVGLCAGGKPGHNGNLASKPPYYPEGTVGCEIELRCNEVKLGSYGSTLRHCFLLITGPGGQRIEVRAGPGNTEPSPFPCDGDPRVPSLPRELAPGRPFGPDWGPVSPYIGPHGPNARPNGDPSPDGDSPSDLITPITPDMHPGKSSCEISNCIMRQMQRYGKSCIPYAPFPNSRSGNSNSAVWFAMKNCGLPLPDITGRPAPGFDHIPNLPFVE
jgi:RHS repeat-associated protein